MPAGPLTFKQTDVARALRAANKAAPGAFAVRIERRTGDILILPMTDEAAQGATALTVGDAPEDDLDRELAEWDAQHQV